MESIVSGLTEQLGVYRSATYTCPASSNYSFLCGSMLLGALTKQMDLLDLFSPRLRRPYLGQTFDVFYATVGSMKSEAWYHSGYSHSGYSHSCNMGTAVKSIVDAAVAKVAGLSLTE